MSRICEPQHLLQASVQEREVKVHVIPPSAARSLVLPAVCSCCCHRTAVAYNPEHCAPEISANMFPTMSIVSYVRNPLGKIPAYRRDRTDIDKPPQ